MRIKAGCELHYRVYGPATLIFNVEAARTPAQTIMAEALAIEPDGPVEPYIMPETLNRYVRLSLARGEVTVRYSCEVALDLVRSDPAAIRETPVAALPLTVLPHLYPSRYCQSDKLGRFARRRFGTADPGHQRVTAICNWIYDHVEYLRGSSDAETSAYDTMAERAGVCRDFAHFGIALCRALDIPARFISAYAEGLVPPDFHAVFEAYLDGRWWLFDPTRQAPLDRLVRIGVGRDAADVAFATLFGGVQPTAMLITAESLDGAGDVLRPTDAVSISAE